MSIDIDAVDFATLLPPLTADEREQLRSSIEAHGVLDPLTYWQETGELIDGYHRSAICDELGIVTYPTVVLSFLTKRDAVLFVIRKHLGRRSLPLSAQSYFREVVKAMAKELVADGMSTRQAAGELGIGKTTVERYVNPPVAHVGHSEPSASLLVQRAAAIPGEPVYENKWCPYCAEMRSRWHRLGEGYWRCDVCLNEMGDTVREQPGLIAPSTLAIINKGRQRALTVGDLVDLPPFPREPDEVRAYRTMMQAIRFVIGFAPDALLDAPREPQMRERDYEDARRFLDWYAGLMDSWSSRRSQPQLRKVQ